MTDLVDEVKASFEKCRDAHAGGEEEVVLVNPSMDEPCPGFNAMRAWYEGRILVSLRRGYRHYAGSTMPTRAEELGELTSQKMTPMLVGNAIMAFSDGVLIGQRHEAQVKISWHFGLIDQLFTEQSFQELASSMSVGLAGDQPVLDYFTGLANHNAAHMAHLTGFAHSTEADPNKIWDIWMLASTSCVASSYLAGYQLGTSWQERDVLDGIEIATEEGNHGPAGEAD